MLLQIKMADGAKSILAKPSAQLANHFNEQDLFRRKL